MNLIFPQLDHNVKLFSTPMGEEGKGENPCSYAGGLEEKRRILECAAQAAWPENDRLERRRGSA